MTSNSQNVAIMEKFGAIRRLLIRQAVSRLKGMKLGTKQLIVLIVVGRRETCSMTELAEYTDSDLAAVSRMMNSLVKGGWLARSKHPEDARQSIIRLGPKGRKRLSELLAVRDEIGEAMLGALSEAERRTLLEIFMKIETALQK